MYRLWPNCATKSFDAKNRSKCGSFETIAEAKRRARSANGTMTGFASPPVSSIHNGAAASANTIEEGLQAMLIVTPEKSSFGAAVGPAEAGGVVGAGVAGAAVGTGLAAV